MWVATLNSVKMVSNAILSKFVSGTDLTLCMEHTNIKEYKISSFEAGIYVCNANFK